MGAPWKKTNMRRAYLAALIGSAVLAIGCGGGDDGHNNADDFDGEDADVVSVVDDFGDAGSDADGDRICSEIFAPELTRTIERESGQSCPSEVEGSLPDDYEVEVDSVNVQNNRATVEVTEAGNRSVLHFVKQQDEWRVISVTPPLTR